ncbi:glutaminase A [Kribbella qitaiheensis]|uniref:Glutaminase n=1 Tax=Kribbella qitaiheensis TaxID=1544730 RepID=A0A7G6WUV1_9ACTN|nr:glutaminase A [Kribbella qitaiheensis]QNE17766.1 glutaminase A [Kribbella qitaiheensis]
MAQLDLESVFRSLDTDRANMVWKWKLQEELQQSGLRGDDPRIERALNWTLSNGTPFQPGQPEWLDLEQFRMVAREPVIYRALQGELAVPAAEFAELSRGIEQIYADLQDERSGEVAQYIPTLRNADPDRFGIAICTADGQVYQVGDAELGFSVQSTSKPFSYAMALEQSGAEDVHRWVGQEQSGGTFNDPRLSLDAAGKPQNPMINAGAMATLALVEPESDVSERFAKVEQTWAKMMGSQPGFDHRTFLAERDTGHGNRGLANLMAAKDMLKVDPRDRDAPQKTAEFYFAVCSLEVDARRLAAAGATLANGGVAPYTGERVFSQETAGRVLSVMGHSGMYNDSGKFSGLVGLPAKSGVSGNVMMVVPEKRLAVVTFSPRLDEAGNSVRGVEVCRRLVNDFGLHPYKGLGAERAREAVTAGRLALDGVARAGGAAARPAGTESAARAALSSGGQRSTGPEIS